jgi:hypothetical protein
MKGQDVADTKDRRGITQEIAGLMRLMAEFESRRPKKFGWLGILVWGFLFMLPLIIVALPFGIVLFVLRVFCRVVLNISNMLCNVLDRMPDKSPRPEKPEESDDEKPEQP